MSSWTPLGTRGELAFPSGRRLPLWAPSSSSAPWTSIPQPAPSYSSTRPRDVYSARSHSQGPSTSSRLGAPPQPMSSFEGPLPQRPSKFLPRQHRSVDLVDYGGRLEEIGVDGVLSQPLLVSTQQQPSTHYRPPPLSNPVNTAASFWNSQPMNARYEAMGSSLEREYEQLKADYEATVEKLNQTMNSIRTFWSPELKRERQLRREENARNVYLQRGLFEDGAMGRAEETIQQLQQRLALREEQIGALQMELAERALEGPSRYREDDRDERIRELEEHILELERGLRIGEASRPRDFTEKTPTAHEMLTLRSKLERSEVELSDRKAELAACHARLRAVEDQNADLKAHLQLVKEANTNREQQNTLLQGDVEALRAKLESKNQAMELKDARIERIEKELVEARGESADRGEVLKTTESKIQQQRARMDGLENAIREKEAELDRMKMKLAAQPDVAREKELLTKLEEGERERRRLVEAVDTMRVRSEKERRDQSDAFQGEVKTLKTSMEALQKELADRDVLLESQNEKIGDLGRELASARAQISGARADRSKEELRGELESARGEVDKLLRMVKAVERERDAIQRQLDTVRSGDDSRMRSAERNPPSGDPGQTAVLRKRIEELEEALRESVSITAEREVHLSQQKHTNHQLTAQLTDARRELTELRRRLSAEATTNAALAERAQWEAERRNQLDELLQLKQEALLAAIHEKEAHMEMLEKAGAPREAVEAVRRQKDALMRRLRDEGERRARTRGASAERMERPATAPPPLGGPSVAAPVSRVPHELGDEDNEGIWA